MESNTNNHVENLTARMLQTNLGASPRLPLRRTITTAQVIEEAAEDWTNSMLGKLICDEEVEFKVLKEEVKMLWRKYSKIEIKTMGHNLYVFKPHTSKSKEEILKKTPWTVDGYLLALQDYNPKISLADHKFISQKWTVKLRFQYVEHLNEKVVDDICKDIGAKISVEPKNCRPRGKMIKVVVEIDLNKPLKRGGWLLNAANEEVWMKYHFEQQPYKICKECYVVDHDQNKCSDIAKELKKTAMTSEELAAWLFETQEGRELMAETDEGKEWLAAREMEFLDARNNNISNLMSEGSSSKEPNLGIMEPSKKRVREEDLNSQQNENLTTTHRNPIFEDPVNLNPQNQTYEDADNEMIDEAFDMPMEGIEMNGPDATKGETDLHTQGKSKETAIQSRVDAHNYNGLYTGKVRNFIFHHINYCKIFILRIARGNWNSEKSIENLSDNHTDCTAGGPNCFNLIGDRLEFGLCAKLRLSGITSNIDLFDQYRYIHSHCLRPVVFGLDNLIVSIWYFVGIYLTWCNSCLNTMKIMAWNVQGFGNKYTRLHLKDLIRSNDPDILFLSETKNNDKKMVLYTKNYGFPNYCYVNPIGLSGGLFLLWKDGIMLDILDCTANFITCMLDFDARKDPTLFVCMYGALTRNEVDNQWSYLKNLYDQYKCSWVVLGDLNFITSTNEKIGGINPLQSQLDDVNYHLDSIGLSDISFLGNPYTWCNRRTTNNLILERLDRGIANVDWFTKFPNSVVYHLIAVGSDHCPILLVNDRNVNDTKKPYRFNSCWLLDPSCKNLITSHWNNDVHGSHAFRLTSNLKNVKYVLKDWNLKVFGNIQTQIKNTQEELSLITQSSNPAAYQDKAKELTEKLKHWYDVQHDFYMQRAKENVLKFDDKNTKYFHDKVKYRKKRTQIDCIQNNMGIRLTDRSMIANDLREHFISISRTSNPPNADSFLLNIESCITASDNDFLTKMPSDVEIKNVVWQMHPWTAPGPDGYPPGFYQKMWGVVGGDIVVERTIAKR